MALVLGKGIDWSLYGFEGLFRFFMSNGVSQELGTISPSHCYFDSTHSTFDGVLELTTSYPQLRSIGVETLVRRFVSTSLSPQSSDFAPLNFATSKLLTSSSLTLD